MKIPKIVIEKVQETLYNLVYLDLTPEQVEEIVESFPESLVVSIQECETGKGTPMSDKSLDRGILDHLSLFLVNKGWPWHANTQIEKEVWDTQMKETFLHRGYKIRDAG